MSQNTTQAQPGVGIVGPVRLSYMNVFQPKENKFRQGESEYSVTLLIPKLPNEFCSDPKAVGKRIKELEAAALEKKFTAKPPKYDSPLKDGDIETNGEGEPKHPGYWFMAARCGVDYPPMLIDGDRHTVTAGWNSGDWGLVKVSMYGYEFNGRKGVGVGLRAIQFTRHDEQFGSGAATSIDEFAVVEGADKTAPAASSEDTPYDPFQD